MAIQCKGLVDTLVVHEGDRCRIYQAQIALLLLLHQIETLFVPIRVDPAHLEERGFFNTGWPMIHEGTPDELSPVIAPWTPAPLESPAPYRALPKVGRNDPCPCGSGKKFKKCCGA